MDTAKMYETTTNVANFSTFLSASGGKNKLNGGWADHSRPVPAEH